jgi:hypothetical protein
VRRGAQLHVPLQLASELLPRLGSGVLYDEDRGELRVFSTPVAERRERGRVPTRAARPRCRASAEARPAMRRRPRAARRLVVVGRRHGGPIAG